MRATFMESQSTDYAAYLHLDLQCAANYSRKFSQGTDDRQYEMCQSLRCPNLLGTTNALVTLRQALAKV